MAIMIPDTPRQHDKFSQEDIIFEALKKLPDDFYVVHSLAITQCNDNVLHQSETDFVIVHARLGVLCLEAKAGKVYYQNGDWYYAGGTLMPHGGPINQAAGNKWKLIDYIRKRNLGTILQSCKFLHGCWFPSITKGELKSVSLPPECDEKIILTKEALEAPEEAIQKIFSIELPNKVQTNLKKREFRRLLEEVICPAFELVPSISSYLQLSQFAMNRLLDEQSKLLNYLEDQPNAVINGAAGTGKTMLAIEKARRHSVAGEKVMFLCFNSKLRDYLHTYHAYENVSYYTIDGFACKICASATPDHMLLKKRLEEMYGGDEFPYQHIIIDEGQDFGQDRIEESGIIEILESIILDNDEKMGTFYIFYDKRQLIQSDRVPSYIADADCKLTLYRNCRNTENIAISSTRLLPDAKKPKLIEGCLKGTPPHIHFETSLSGIRSAVDNVVQRHLEQGVEDIVILTCKTESTSIFADLCADGFYHYDDRAFPFSTCRKFKGLEADAIILMDIDTTLDDEKQKLLFYVGASRARYSLDLICPLTKPECVDLLDRIGMPTSSKNPQRALASILNAIC